MRMPRTLFVIVLLMNVAGCRHIGMEAIKKESVSMPAPSPFQAALHEALQAAPAHPLIPELATAAPAHCAVTPTGAELLKWGRDAAEVTTIPATTYTLYRQFRATGERGSYQRPYYEKRTLLTREVMAAWLSQDFSRMDRINDLIWSICEETTWVVPAHEKDTWCIDLFSAETGTTLAHVLCLLGEHLPQEIQDRVRMEVRARIFDNYRAHAREFSWNSGRSNWTGVCAGSVGESFLLLEDDTGRLEESLSVVLEQLDRFINTAFTADGASLEGMGYWNYGLSHYVMFGEMLRARTHGAIDLLAQDKIKAIARYPLSVYLGNELYASFSDDHEHNAIEPYLGTRIAERTGTTTLLGLLGPPQDWVIGGVLRNVLWCDAQKHAVPAPDDVFLAQAGLARLVATWSGKPVALAVRAGHNDEPHNHNDVGSFILCAGGQISLCDPGAGLYNGTYFSPKRYENIFANSYGHSVPRIGGKLQSAGIARKGTLEQTGPKSVRIRFDEAYEAPGLKLGTRTFSLTDEALSIEDTFQFDGAGSEVEEAFITWKDVVVSGDTARIATDAGTIEIKSDGASFSSERLEEACKANAKEGVLTRLTVTYPAAPKTIAHFVVRLLPAPQK